MTLKPLLTTLGSTFGGAAIGELHTELLVSTPTTGQQITSMLVGAAVVGLVALVHLYQAKPGGIDASVNAADAASAKGAP